MGGSPPTGAVAFAHDAAASTEDFWVGEWLVQPSRNRICRGERALHLEAKPIEVLRYLSCRAGGVASKEDVMQAVWPDTFVSDQALSHAIWVLREAFGAEGKGVIETIPKRGYRLTVAVRRKAAMGPATSPKECGEELAGRTTAAAPVAKPAGAGRSWWQSRRVRWATAVGVLLAAGLLTSFAMHRRSAAAAKPARTMVAVLPFDNLSGDPKQEPFSDGMTEEMIAQLGRVNPQRLGVIARATAMTYKNQRKSAEQIGRELNVEYILQGSVRRNGRRVRITAALIAVREQSPVWTEIYEQDVSDVLTVQEDIAQQIARALEKKVVRS